MQEDKTHKTILWLDQISNNDVSMVGGKNASLGEMYNTLISQGIRIPNAFVVTAHAYRRFINESKLAVIIHKELAGLDTNNIKALQKKGKVIRAAFLEVNIPKDMEEEIRLAYRDLSSAYRMKGADVAVRSSATAEDLPGASFAGEHETFLNITGEQAVLDAIRAAMASLFTDRAISYRVDKGFDHFDVALSVGVQKMVRSDKGASGVMFTLDTETGFRNVIEISSSWGLGEMVVQGKVTPDEFIVFKPALNEGFPSIIKKSIGAKRRKMIYQDLKISPVKEVDTTTAERNMQSITDEEALTLARWGILIERHYTKRAGPGHESPMDMEWAKDGVSGDLFIVQARPETVQSEKKGFEIVEYRLKEEGEKIIEGISVGTAIVSGRARVILSTKKLSEFKNGEILITEITDPDWEPVMKKSAAIITEKGGRTSHAAIVSRELGIPAVIGVGDALSHIKTGDMITVDCSSGSVGKVYRGKLRFERRSHNLSEIPKVRTTLALNVGSPEGAFVHSFLPHKGVGLAREEFIIASQIRIHPLALINFSTIKDKALKRKIENLTIGYSDKKRIFCGKTRRGNRADRRRVLAASSHCPLL